RLLRADFGFEDLVSRVLSLDYIGALLASLVFPLWMVPQLGLVRTGLAFGLLNIAVAMATLWVFRGRISGRNRAPGLWLAAGFSFAALCVAFAGAERFARNAEERLYRG